MKTDCPVCAANLFIAAILIGVRQSPVEMTPPHPEGRRTLALPAARGEASKPERIPRRHPTSQRAPSRMPMVCKVKSVRKIRSDGTSLKKIDHFLSDLVGRSAWQVPRKALPAPLSGNGTSTSARARHVGVHQIQRHGRLNRPAHRRTPAPALPARGAVRDFTALCSIATSTATQAIGVGWGCASLPRGFLPVPFRLYGSGAR
jgi:hypothetical protein